MLNLDTTLTFDEDLIKQPNICDRFEDWELERIGETAHRGYIQDLQSRARWEKRMQAALDLAMQVTEEKNFPWAGCSNVVFPLVTIAALQFSARAYSNIIQGTNVVRYRVIAKDQGQARERAKRIGKHMSWQVLEEDESWEEEHDRLLINLSIIGSNFVKGYYDASKGYPVGELVMAKDLVMNYYAKSVAKCSRKTQIIPLYRNEVYERCAREVFVDVREEKWFDQPPMPPNAPKDDKRRGMTPPLPDEYTPFMFHEQHTWFDFDKDGYSEPYIVTYEEHSKKVVRIVARVEDIDHVTLKSDEIIHIKAEEYFTKYSFLPSPDGGVYDLGFGVFLGPLNEAVNAGINQLIDRGTMQNSLGGFLGRGARIRGGSYIMAPWEWKRVDSTGDDLRKNVVPFPERAADEVMFKLLGLLIEYSNRVAGTVDPTVGENPGQNTPASTFQGMTEQGMQIFGMTFKRVWRSMKEEFKRRYGINKYYLEPTQDFGSDDDFIRKEDYTGSPDQVAPVANPRVTSTIMRVQQTTAMKQSAMGTPGYDVYETEIAWLESLEVEGIDRLFPGPGRVPQGHEMVNPKVMVENLKEQTKQMKIKADMMIFANQLLEDQRVNNAKIRQLEAQALKLMSEAKSTDGAARLEAFNSLIEAHAQYGDMLNNRIKALLGGGSSGESDEGGGVQGMARKPGNGSDSSVSIAVPGGSNVSVGRGTVQ